MERWTFTPMSDKRHRFPRKLIAHAMWLYFRFPLSFRLIEGAIVVSYETIRRWALKFGADYARRLKHKTPSRGDIWHPDEVVISVHREKRYLRRAVDQEGYVLDEIVRIHRNTKAARRLLTRLLRKQGGPPQRIVTDKLCSCGAAKRAIMQRIEHRQHKGLNNRAENSNVPMRKRERMMQGFRSWPGLPRSVSTFSAIPNHFVPSRSRRSPYPLAVIASRRWRNGNPSPSSPPEN